MKFRTASINRVAACSWQKGNGHCELHGKNAAYYAACSISCFTTAMEETDSHAQKMGEGYPICQQSVGVSQWCVVGKFLFCLFWFGLPVLPRFFYSKHFCSKKKYKIYNF